MKNSKGISLLETMVILALIAILATIAIPSITGPRDNAKLRDAVSMIRGDFEMARSWAIRENAFAAVLIGTDGYFIFIDNGAGSTGVAEDWVPNGDERILCNRQLPSGISINQAQTTFSDKRVRFNGRGISTNSGILILDAPNGKSSTIDMNNRFGRITSF